MRVEYLSGSAALIPMLARWHYKEWDYFNPGSSVEDFIARPQSHLNRKKIPKTYVALSNAIPRGSASLVAHDMDTRMDLSPLARECVHSTGVSKSRGWKRSRSSYHKSYQAKAHGRIHSKKAHYTKKTGHSQLTKQSNRIAIIPQ